MRMADEATRFWAALALAKQHAARTDGAMDAVAKFREAASVGNLDVASSKLFASALLTKPKPRTTNRVDGEM